MKKTFALVLVLAAIMLCSVALADAPIIGGPLFDGDVKVPYDTDAEILTIAHNGSDYTWEIVSIKDGKVSDVDATAAGWYYSETNPLTGDKSIHWDYNAIGDDTPVNGEVQHRLIVTYTDDEGNQQTVTQDFYVDWFGYEHPWGYGLVTSATYDLVSLPSWYPNNTANSFGPKVNGTWQTYSVVDLTVQGTQEFDLIGAGAWKLGTVTVTVDGDNVTVDYLMSEDVNTRDTWDDITVDSEYLNFFADADSIDLSAESTYAFGQTYSIANDLGGDTTVCLVVSNKVDYPSHSPYVVRFWPNLPENKAIVEAMTVLLAD